MIMVRTLKLIFNNNSDSRSLIFSYQVATIRSDIDFLINICKRQA